MSAMSVRTGAAIVAAAALLGLVARPAAQDPKRTFTETPEFMPTAVTVTGRVSVDNSPVVQAQQAGEWRVSLARAPIVYWGPPPFLEVGRIYRFGSSSTDTVVYRIAELGFNGWVHVEPPVDAQAAAAIWMNVDRLTVIEEIEEDVPQDTGTP